MLTPQQIASLAFAVTRARLLTPATHAAAASVAQAEAALEQLRVDDVPIAQALADLHLVHDYITTDHPFGKDATLRCLKRARDLIENSKSI